MTGFRCCLISDMQTNSLTYLTFIRITFFSITDNSSENKTTTLCLSGSIWFPCLWLACVCRFEWWKGLYSFVIMVCRTSNMFFFDGEKAGRGLFKRINLRDFGLVVHWATWGKEIGGTHACGWVPVLSYPPLFTTPGCHGSLLYNQKGERRQWANK